MILLLVGGIIMANVQVAYADRFDSLIKYYAHKYGVPWEILKAQMIVESSANTRAKSPVGAEGLMQFMPATWEEWKPSKDADVYNPEDAIEAGAKYLTYLYERFPEIPSVNERWKFALAAYNAGRGNINEAIKLARGTSHFEWIRSGSRPGVWQMWWFTREFLVKVTGKHSKETINYVDKIVKLSGEFGYPW